MSNDKTAFHPSLLLLDPHLISSQVTGFHPTSICERLSNPPIYFKKSSSTSMRYPRISYKSPLGSDQPMVGIQRNAKEDDFLISFDFLKDILKRENKTDELLEKKVRTPSPETGCACSSGKSYGKCCKPFHEGRAYPQQPIDLLRSRYSAYAYVLPNYIMSTTHYDNPDYSQDHRGWLKEILDFAESYRFVGLEILERQFAGPNVTYILFRANMVDKGQVVNFIERSKFILDKGKWMYASGKLVEVERDE